MRLTCLSIVLPGALAAVALAAGLRPLATGRHAGRVFGPQRAADQAAVRRLHRARPASQVKFITDKDGRVLIERLAAEGTQQPRPTCC
ncbi:MAG: hypothetical protein MZV65_17525 [Chromatiales bacterium]|nr:hypothetical protein [Chromatiales bacterium]